MRKKKLGLTVAICMIMASLSACSTGGNNGSDGTQNPSTGDTGSNSEQTAESASPNEEAFEISVAHWLLGNANAYAQAYMENVEKLYKEKYPNATIKWNPIQGEKYHELLKAQLSTGSAPDVFFHQNSLVPFAKAGYLADLSDQPWASEIYPSTKAENTYEGKVLGAPVDVSGWGIFYNKKVFNDLGISVPANYQEFLDACEKLKAAGIIPITSGYKDGWPATGTWIAFASFLYGTNPNIANDLFDGKTKINGPEFTAMFEAYDQLVKKEYLSKSILSTTYDQAVQQVAEGKAAMHFNGPWVNSVVADKYQVDLGFFPIPDSQGNNYMTTATNASLSLNAKYADRQRGIDMVNALIDSSTLPGLLQNSAFSGLKGIDIPHSTSGGLDYAEALNKYQSEVQPSVWLPASTYDKFTQIVTKITAGKGFTAADLDDVDAAYQKDKGLLNIK